MSNAIKPIIVKIGTSALSNGLGLPDEKILRPVVEQLIGLKQDEIRALLVTSGAVGIGKALVKERIGDAFAKASNETLRRQHFAAIGQYHLMALYQSMLPKNRLAEQYLLTAGDFYPLNKCALNALRDSLKNPFLLPIVNENDVTAIEELTISDNDKLAGLLAQHLNASHLIILSNVEGVYKSMNDKEVIPVLNFSDPKTFPQNIEGKSASGIGGVKSKIMVAENLTRWRKNMRVHLAAAREPDVILRIMRGENVGTRFTCG